MPLLRAVFSHCGTTFSLQQSESAAAILTCAHSGAMGKRQRSATHQFSRQNEMLTAFSFCCSKPVTPHPAKGEQFYNRSCSGCAFLARISPTELRAYGRDLSSSLSIAFCCSCNALRSPVLSAISFFSRVMAIVTFIHWRRSYLLSILSICRCGINVNT